jgi:putative NADPH-quinone reductase
MKLLVVFCHPNPESFNAAICTTAVAALEAAGHDVRLIDLYAENFNPVFSREERASYIEQTHRNVEGVADHVTALQAAEGLIVIYPTWYYGPPAMLKGWLERVYLPEIAFGLSGSRHRPIVGKLRNIRLFVGITTSGSPWWWLKVVGDPGKSLFMKGLRPLYARRCKTRWLQLFSMNYVTEAERKAFLAKVQHTLSGLTA